MDKPVGFSSFQVVRMLQKRYKKVGHAGTLDPFASGLLIVLTGDDTKRFQEFESHEKEYRGEMLIGVVTETYDISGAVVTQGHAGVKPTRAMIEDAARRFSGTYDQVPPRFSALKHRGRKLYELSRKGIHVSPGKRTVTVQSFSIDAYDHPIAAFTTIVGKGVYVRSLAHDIGQWLGSGATLLSLRRLRIGNHSVDQARPLGALIDDAAEGVA